MPLDCRASPSRARERRTAREGSPPDHLAVRRTNVRGRCPPGAARWPRSSPSASVPRRRRRCGDPLPGPARARPPASAAPSATGPTRSRAPTSCCSTPAGTEVDSMTTEADGKYSFQVTEAGRLLPVRRPRVAARRRGDHPAGTALPGRRRQHPGAGQSSAQTRTPRTSTSAPSTTTPRAPASTSEIAQSIAQGLRLGLLLALASVGLSLIYGTTGLSNFAHAEQVTLGGMVAYGLVNVGGHEPLARHRADHPHLRRHRLLPGPRRCGSRCGAAAWA